MPALPTLPGAEGAAMDPALDKVLVLGANGFVGSAIMRSLAAAPDFEPVAGVRRRRSSSDAADDRVFDATDAAALESALQGTSFAVCSILGSRATMLASTRNLCEAARRTGTRRLVFISSMAVYGPATGLVDESAPLDGSLGRYAAAKVACERIVDAYVAAGGAATILRPGIVYGPGGEQWIGRIGRLLRSGRLGDLGPFGEGLCNLIDCGDLGAATVAALSAPAAAGEAINLAERDPATWNAFFHDLGRAIGVLELQSIPRWRLHAEQALLAPALQASKLAASRLGWRPGTLPEPIPPSLRSLWGQKIRLDHRKAEALLGLAYTPRNTGLARAAAWFLAREREADRRLGRASARA